MTKLVVAELTILAMNPFVLLCVCVFRSAATSLMVRWRRTSFSWAVKNVSHSSDVLEPTALLTCTRKGDTSYEDKILSTMFKKRGKKEMKTESLMGSEVSEQKISFLRKPEVLGSRKEKNGESIVPSEFEVLEYNEFILHPIKQCIVTHGDFFHNRRYEEVNEVLSRAQVTVPRPISRHA